MSGSEPGSSGSVSKRGVASDERQWEPSVATSAGSADSSALAEASRVSIDDLASRDPILQVALAQQRRERMDRSGSTGLGSSGGGEPFGRTRTTEELFVERIAAARASASSSESLSETRVASLNAVSRSVGAGGCARKSFTSAESWTDAPPSSSSSSSSGLGDRTVRFDPTQNVFTRPPPSLSTWSWSDAVRDAVSTWRYFAASSFVLAVLWTILSALFSQLPFTDVTKHPEGYYPWLTMSFCAQSAWMSPMVIHVISAYLVNSRLTEPRFLGLTGFAVVVIFLWGTIYIALEPRKFFYNSADMLGITMLALYIGTFTVVVGRKTKLPVWRVGLCFLLCVALGSFEGVFLIPLLPRVTPEVGFLLRIFVVPAIPVVAYMVIRLTVGTFHVRGVAAIVFFFLVFFTVLGRSTMYTLPNLTYVFVTSLALKAGDILLELTVVRRHHIMGVAYRWMARLGSLCTCCGDAGAADKGNNVGRGTYDVPEAEDHQRQPRAALGPNESNPRLGLSRTIHALNLDPHDDLPGGLVIEDCYYGYDGPVELACIVATAAVVMLFRKHRLAFDVGFLYSRQYVTGGEVVSNWWIVAAAAIQIGVEVVGQTAILVAVPSSGLNIKRVYKLHNRRFLLFLVLQALMIFPMMFLPFFKTILDVYSDPAELETNCFREYPVHLYENPSCADLLANLTTTTLPAP